MRSQYDTQLALLFNYYYGILKARILFSLVGLLICVALLFSSCVHKDYHQILGKSSSDWRILDCQTIIAASTAHNFHRNSPVAVMATPFTPSVIMSLARYQQLKHHLSETEYSEIVDDVAFSTSGLYFDWQKDMYVDKQGNYYKRDIRLLDSLLFVIRIINKTYPCVSPIVVIAGAMYHLFGPNPADWPCYRPDIQELEQNIYLKNEKHEKSIPRFVWGRKNLHLEKEEVILALFPLEYNGNKILADSEKFFLVIEGFGDNIQIEFNLDVLQ